MVVRVVVVVMVVVIVMVMVVMVMMVVVVVVISKVAVHMVTLVALCIYVYSIYIAANDAVLLPLSIRRIRLWPSYGRGSRESGHGSHSQWLGVCLKLDNGNISRLVMLIAALGRLALVVGGWVLG